MNTTENNSDDIEDLINENKSLKNDLKDALDLIEKLKDDIEEALSDANSSRLAEEHWKEEAAGLKEKLKMAKEIIEIQKDLIV